MLVRNSKLGQKPIKHELLLAFYLTHIEKLFGYLPHSLLIQEF